MPIYTPKPQYENPKPGRHLAVLVDVYQETRNGMQGPYDALVYAWELGASNRRKDGSPFFVRQAYGNSRGKKSSLRKMLTGWFGHTISEEEWDALNHEDLRGRVGDIKIVLNTTTSGTFANIESVDEVAEDRIAAAPRPSGQYKRMTRNANQGGMKNVNDPDSFEPEPQA